MKNIEVEIRSFIEEKKYSELLNFFLNHGENHTRDIQETWYFDSNQDFRIQKNSYHAKFWLKQGKMHDEAREEIEIKFNKHDFVEAAKMMEVLGYKPKIKWFRERDEWDWDDIKVSLDFTRGYGYIIELEKMSTESEKGKDLALLKSKLSELEIELTPKEDFKEKFEYYEKNWEKLTVA